MINVCPKCEQRIKEGDVVQVQVTATYHELKSQVVYALDKDDMEADATTLEHQKCLQST